MNNIQKIFLKKGETKEISFNIMEDDLKFYNYDLKRIFKPGEFLVLIGASSDNNKKSSFTLAE